MMGRTVSLIAVLALVITVPFILSDSDGDGGSSLLIDYGNGDYEWIDVTMDGSCLDVLEVCKGVSGTPVLIDGIGRTVTSGDTEVVSDWRVFSWSGDGWVYEGDDLSIQFTDNMALAFYPEGFSPVITPDSPTAWTQLGGSSSSDGVSSSYGPEEPRLPVEWYRTYTTGYVDSGLVVAGDLLYHTTGGTYGASGSDADPRVYCLDRLTGDIMWEYHGTIGAGYEVTTPVIIDGFLVVSLTNGDVIVFDRFTGKEVDRMTLPFDPPKTGSGDIAWDGRVFVTGATTPVYDSGALYFGTADGRVMCCSLSPDGQLSDVWCYEPPVGIRGCFYYHAPVISIVDGVRMLFIGSYEGYLHALDASTGEPVWVERVIDLRAEGKTNVPPGSAATVTLGPDSSVLIVTCTDSAMIPERGFSLFLDPATGETIRDGDGNDIRLDVLMTKPVALDDGFITYITPTSSGDRTLRMTDGSSVEVRNAVYRFDWNGDVVWMSSDYQMIKAQLTYADGVVYAMDYSAGAMWPTGGGVTAIDADTGDEDWRLLLRPCTEQSFSMVQVTVVDGRLYAANDLGAVYCLSSTAGAGTDEERLEVLETQGFHHWSWAVLFAVAVGALLLAVRFYRGSYNG